MTEPQIKDAILGFLIENPNTQYGSREIADRFQISEQQLKEIISIINAGKGPWIDDRFTLHNSDFMVCLWHKSKIYITKFLHEGGYSREEEEKNIAVDKRDNLYRLTVENLTLANEAAHDARLNADKAESRAKSANCAAWVASIAAVGIILWELIKTFVLKNN